MTTNASVLRQSALKGGIYLAGRQVISIGLKFMGVMVITRYLGPSSYGSYVSAFNVYQYILMLGQAGVGVYLLRQEEAVSARAYGTAYSMLLGASVFLVVAIEIAKYPLSDWIGVDGFLEVMTVILVALPFQLMSVPPSVMLERSLNYKAVAGLELFGQLVFYAIGVPLVMLGYGPVSLGFAWVGQQAAACLMAYVLAKTYPKFHWDSGIAKLIFRYAASFSLANWTWQLRMLINPLIVGPALGAQAVGLVGMTIGLLEMLSIIKTIVWRLSVAVLSKVQTDITKLRNAVTEGMELQTLAIGAILLGFGFTGRIIVPHLFGERWAPVMDIYPYIALSYLTAAPFNMHSAVMSILNRNRDLAICFAAHIVLFASVASFTVPAFGMVGYGYGELATLPTYILIHLYLARAIGSPDYRVAALWWAGAAVGLFWAQFGLWAVAVPFVVLALPISLRRVRRYVALVRYKAELA